MALAITPISNQKVRLYKPFLTGETTIQTVGRIVKTSTSSQDIGNQFFVVSDGTDSEILWIATSGSNPTLILDRSARNLENIYEYAITYRGIDSDEDNIPPSGGNSNLEKDFTREENTFVAPCNHGALYKSLSDDFNTVVDGSKTKIISAVLFDTTTDVTVGDARIVFPPLGSIFANHELTRVFASHTSASDLGVTGTTTIQVHNLTDGVDMLSTPLTIDAGERDSSTAATPAVIDTSNDDVTTNDLIRIDIDATCTTPAKGLNITLEFTLIS